MGYCDIKMPSQEPAGQLVNFVVPGGRSFFCLGERGVLVFMLMKLTGS